MEPIVKYDGKGYIFLPKEPALLYADFSVRDALDLVRDPNYSIEKITSNGVKEGLFARSYFGKGQMIFSVSTDFYRGEIDKTKTFIVKENSVKNLEDAIYTHSNNESLADLASDIKNKLPAHDRDNSYALTQTLLDWIKENIEYTIVPKSLILDVEKNIALTSKNDIINVYKVIKSTFANYNFNSTDAIVDDTLKELSNEMRSSIDFKELTNYKFAKELMNQLNYFWPNLQSSWDNDNALSAYKTLENKSGKCTGITNLFVAVSKNLGIPSSIMRGYAGDKLGSYGRGHDWAVSKIEPYGWVEIDPTWHQFTNFDHISHAYLFSVNSNDLPQFTFMEKDMKCDKKILDRRIKTLTTLLEADKNIFNKLFGTKKHKSEIEFLQSLKK